MTDLGYKPLRGKLLLSDGADWVCTLSTGVAWPTGTLVWCKVGDLPQWDAVVTEVTGTAAFKVESATTDLVDDGAVVHRADREGVFAAERQAVRHEQALGLAANDSLERVPYVLRGKLAGGALGARRFADKGVLDLSRVLR